MTRAYHPQTEDLDFESFWRAYPCKKSKGDARKAWEQTQKIRPPLQEIEQAILRCRQSRPWRQGYVEYPATWLRREGWEDYRITPAPVDLSAPPRKPWLEGDEGILYSLRYDGFSEADTAWVEAAESEAEANLRVVKLYERGRTTGPS